MGESTTCTSIPSELSSINVCYCHGDNTQPDEAKDGPLYTHLGTADSVASLRRTLLKDLCLQDEALRIEKVVYTTKEGSTKEGCPLAKWIIRRSSEREKILVLVKERIGHHCTQAVIVIAFVKWEGIPSSLSESLYGYLTDELPQYGIVTERRCGTNESRTCACQGFDESKGGASYSFGCSWSMFHNACKFARTKENAKKFRLKFTDHEQEMEKRLNYLADVVGKVYSEISPTAFKNQTESSELAEDCRLGTVENKLKPFSGVSANLDFATHAHKDVHNMEGGCTVVVTLNKPAETGESSQEEQLHVLTNYFPADSDEFGEKGFEKRAIECLTNFPKVTRIRAVPLDSCAARKKKKLSSNNKPIVKEDNSPASIDSGFESIKSNQSPEKSDDLSLTMSPQLKAPSPGYTCKTAPITQVACQEPSTNVLPPISAWFRKGSIDWVPPQPKQVCMKSAANTLMKSDLPSHPQCPPQPIQQAQQLPHAQQHHPVRGEYFQDYQHNMHQQQYIPRYPQPHMQSQPSYYPMQNMSEPQNPYGNRAINYPNYPQQQYMHPYAPARPYGGAYPIPQNQYQRPACYGRTTADYSYPYPRHSGPNGYPSGYYQEPYAIPYQHLPVQHHPHPYTQFPNHPRMQPPQVPMQYMQFQEPHRQRNLDYPPNNEVHGFEETFPQYQGSNRELDQLIPPLIPPKTAAGKTKSKRKQSGMEVNNREYHSNNAEAFEDPLIGGVAIALTDGSILIEAAKKEVHATTALKNPDRYHPTRISMVFYQHKNLCYARHGFNEYAEKMILKQKRAEESALTCEQERTQSDGHWKSEIKEEPAAFLKPSQDAHTVGIGGKQSADSL